MNFPDKLQETQKYLTHHGIDGWLLYDFRKQNDLAISYLEIPRKIMMTRRFFYWIPASGEPIKIVHAIEENNLIHLPGSRILYTTWQKMEEVLKQTLTGKRKILMEYSKNNAVPYLSKVDGGTLEWVRSCGVDVESSGNLLQRYTSVWNDQKYSDHTIAAQVLDEAVYKAWKMIGSRLKDHQVVNEYQVQQMILDEIKAKGCKTEEPPIVAVNAHSADPHYLPNKDNYSRIRKGDFILIDLYCQMNQSDAPYADITRVAVASDVPGKKHKKIFEIVKKAQETALSLVETRFSSGEKLMAVK